MRSQSVEQLLAEQLPLDEEVLVQGWLRSVRSSKGGFSFLSLHDGSCFEPIQVVADSQLGELL